MKSLESSQKASRNKAFTYSVDKNKSGINIPMNSILSIENIYA